MRTTRIRDWILFLLILMSGLLAAGCGDHDDEAIALDLSDTVNELQPRRNHEHVGHDGKQFRFGFDLRASPQEDARQYLPFLAYLSKATGYEFKLAFTPGNSSIVDELGKGNIHFAAVGADSYITAKYRHDAVVLVRGINEQGRAEYRSKIVVDTNSHYQDIKDLRGKRFAFGSVTSTQGHLIPRIIMDEYGLELSDFTEHSYTGSHQNCVNAVIAQTFDACGMQDTMADEMARQGLVRILYESRYYPSSGIAAHPDLPAEVLEKVKQALLDFDPKGRDNVNLYNWERTEMPKGFTRAEDADYAELREWMLKLGLMKDGVL